MFSRIPCFQLKSNMDFPACLYYHQWVQHGVHKFSYLLWIHRLCDVTMVLVGVHRMSCFEQEIRLRLFCYSSTVNERWNINDLGRSTCWESFLKEKIVLPSPITDKLFTRRTILVSLSRFSVQYIIRKTNSRCLFLVQLKPKITWVDMQLFFSFLRIELIALLERASQGR